MSFVSIPLEEHLELLEKARKLEALEVAGVDNWEGYDFAMEEFYKGFEDE
jgi:hypothetical protein